MKRTVLFKTLSILICMILAPGTVVPASLAAEGYTAAFTAEGGEASFNVYYTQDYTTPGETNAAAAVARDGDTGEISADGSGQINFTVIPAEGYEVASVAATEGTYKNIKGPADTGVADTYRITKITADLTVTVTLQKAESSEETSADAYTGSFVIEGGSASVDVYYTQDYTAADETDVSSAIARNSDTGEATVLGDGQINFKVNPADGCEVAGITATEGTYKNIKEPADTGADNVYRITKITADLTVTITLREAGDAAEEETGDTVIAFTDEAATVSGSAAGVSVSGTDVKITAAGTYTFTGSCAKGSIVVKKNVTGVTLVLNGLTLTASATAPITCNKGSGVTILAAEGTVNTLTDDRYNNDDLYTDTTLYPDIENAVIKCKDGSNVTIGGTGTVNVYAYGKNGVKGGYDLYEEDADGNATDTLLSAASLTIKDVTLNITATVNDGLKSDKELNILSGNITVSAADDGVKSDYVLNIGAQGTDGPTVNVTKSYEGIEAATLNVYSGNVKVYATDDGINAANGDLTNYSFSYNQYGGTVYVNCENGDGIDSNGTMAFDGGVFEVHSPSQGDGDPIDGEGTIAFNGATILAVGNNAMQNDYTGVYVAFGGSSSQQGGMNMGGWGGNGGWGGMRGAGGFGGMDGGTTIVSAGSAITIQDASGNTLYTATAVRDASYVVYADADMTAGSSYTLYVDGAQAAVGTAVSNTQQGGGFPGGNQPTPPGGNQPTRPGNEQPSQPTNEQPAQPTGTDPGKTDALTTGDIDGDGEATAEDARLALRAAVGLETLTDAQQAAADADGDGSVTPADARLILRASVGLETLSR